MNNIRIRPINIGGIFPSIGNAQPAIKAIRDKVNFLDIKILHKNFTSY